MYKIIFLDQDDTLCPAKNNADMEMIGLLEKLMGKYIVAITSG
jgi:hydroxymethylpyrimidine pyrophosphatase-like HAD family hydrolase